MILHGHRNLIVYAVPFLPLAFATLGAAVAQLRLPKWTHATPAAFAAAALIANPILLHARAVERSERDRTAADRLQIVLAGEEKPVPPGDGSPPLTVGPLPVDPPFLPNELAFTPMLEPASPTGRMRFSGWVPIPRERSSRVRGTVLCAVDGRVVVPRVGYFRWSGAERLLDSHATFAAFQGCVDAPEPGRPLRIFFVPWDGSLPVTELWRSEP